MRSLGAPDDATLKSADELHAIYEGTGVTPEHRVVNRFRSEAEKGSRTRPANRGSPATGNADPGYRPRRPTVDNLRCSRILRFV